MNTTQYIICFFIILAAVYFANIMAHKAIENEKYMKALKQGSPNGNGNGTAQ